MSGVTFPKTWADGETLTHTDLNATTAAINTAVGVASGLASLNSSTLVVEDPANATATKAAGKICKWGASEAFQCSALTATQVTATIADGTAPVVTTSKTICTNLTAGGVGDGTNRILTKIVNIGDWNMDSTASVTVAHGLTLANIRDVQVLIRQDLDTPYYPLDYSGHGYWNVISAGGVVALYRTAGGTFDSTDFDATSFNRGWITITYVE